MADYGYQAGSAGIGTYDSKVAYVGSADAPAEPGPFSTASSAFQDAHGLAHRVMALADRLCGPVPTPVQNGTSTGEISAMFPALRRGSEQVASVIREAHAALDRIDRQAS